MEDFVASNKRLKFSVISGEVLGSSKYSKTHVHSSGGGGYVGNRGGHVSAPTVYSTTSTNQDIWIRDDQDNEVPIQLSGADIPLREGQRISMILAGYANSDSVYNVALVNHSVGRHWYLISDLDEYFRLSSLQNPIYVAILKAMFVGLLAGGIALIMDWGKDWAGGLAWIVGIATFFIVLVSRVKTKVKVKLKVKQYLENVIAEVYANKGNSNSSLSVSGSPA